ncbi:MAG: amino acid racemase [Brevundimonas sp.]|uniref:aspartate/glutamate racemase family protein n=1 Tax=Brevundimonas sp. TaxID=1871086 RepID=UPI0024888386|nr:amino acid racemase [Brevundimonas sp.]MDI1327773.1 amino acid racemase [Brevundimonas sp.]
MRSPTIPNHGRWAEAGQVLAMEARALKAGGADFAVLCTNTMHKVADAIVCGSGLALIHIVDVAAGRLTAGGIRAVGLLGTRFVMEEDFYGGEMSARHGVDVLLPGEADRAFLHAVIYGELAKGLVTSATRDRCQAIIADLASQGAQAILLACTELPLVVSEADHAIPIYSTTTLHALLGSGPAGLAGRGIGAENAVARLTQGPPVRSLAGKEWRTRQDSNL